MISFQSVGELYLKLSKDYHENLIDVEESVHGKNTLFKLMRITLGEIAAREWLDEMFKLESEPYNEI